MLQPIQDGKSLIGRLELKPESEWVWLPIEPIISEEPWERCNAKLSTRAKREYRPTRRPVHLLLGLVFCAEDGEKMYPLSKRPPKYTCKTCRRGIRADDLEAMFVLQLRAFVFSPQQIEENASAADADLREKLELLEAARADRARVGAEAEKLYRLYMADQISPEGSRVGTPRLKSACGS